MRNFQFNNGEYYHIYNRGVDKREIFLNEKDYLRFLKSISEYNNNSLYEQRVFIRNRNHKERGKELSSEASELSSYLSNLPKFVEIISYCLISNHYHFLLKQLVNNGISKFLHKLDLGYTHFFNKKYSRTGSLFQGTYKAIQVTDYSYLLKLLVYVNCNYKIHNLGGAKDWVWSSYLDSVGLKNGTLCNLEIIKEEFEGLKNFKSFCEEIIPDIKESKQIKKYLLE